MAESSQCLQCKRKSLGVEVLGKAALNRRTAEEVPVSNSWTAERPANGKEVWKTVLGGAGRKGKVPERPEARSRVDI